eukprot:7152572-Pyramimonas_sp.AAC.1
MPLDMKNKYRNRHAGDPAARIWRVGSGQLEVPSAARIWRVAQDGLVGSLGVPTTLRGAGGREEPDECAPPSPPPLG